MKIEMISNYKSGGETFLAGEVRVVPDSFGTRMVASGYAQDPEGKIPTGERKSEPVRLKPEDIFQKGAVTNG